MRITLNGDLGSGKSTIGTRLSELLGIPYISTGKLFREIGQIANLDALQTNLAAEDNSQIDFAVDEKIKEHDRVTPNFILDSRLAWHFVHDALNVFLSVEPETAALRVMSDSTRKTEKYTDLKTAMESLQSRRKSENKRYKSLYGVDIDDTQNYDLVIISDDAQIDDIVWLIAEFAKKQFIHKFWIPKTRIVPMITIRDASGIKFATRLTPNDPFRLRLYTEKNYGFYFGSGNDLINAFHYASGLVPYISEVPQFLSRSKYDVFNLAIKTLRPSDVYNWEELGNVRLAFGRYLEQVPRKAQ